MVYLYCIEIKILKGAQEGDSASEEEAVDSASEEEAGDSGSEEEADSAAEEEADSGDEEEAESEESEESDSEAADATAFGEDEEPGLSPAVIAAIVVGSLVGILMIGTAIFKSYSKIRELYTNIRQSA